MEVVSLDDLSQVAALTANAKVCISLVTYWRGSIGEVIVQACIQTRTDYLDV